MAWAWAWRWVMGCFWLGISGVSEARLPLSIEELLVEPRVTKLQGSMSFHNSERPALRYDTPTGDTLAIVPDAIRQQETVTSFRFRHGLARHLEVHLGATTSHRSIDGLTGTRSGSDTWRASAGANWLVSADTQTPALLLQAAVDLLERGGLPGESREWGRTARIGATTYRAIDPLVLSLSMQYQHRLARDTALGNYDPGGQWTLKPQVNFAVNYRVTLVGGVTLQHRAADRLGRRRLTPSAYHSALNLGLGLLVGEHSTLFAETHVSTSGGEGAALMLDWLYRF